MKNLIKFESFNREGNIVDFDLSETPSPVENYDREADTIEFDIPSNDEAWNDIYKKFLSKNKNIDNFTYHQWLTKNFYAPVKK